MHQISFAEKAGRWCVYEVCVSGPTEGNPFDQVIKGTFVGKVENVTVDGFYDGDGMCCGGLMAEN